MPLSEACGDVGRARGAGQCVPWASCSHGYVPWVGAEHRQLLPTSLSGHRLFPKSVLFSPAAK